jgi:Tfp pilus assembly protein PilN
VNSKLNLASQPFRNRALPWTITGVVVSLSLVALVYIITSTNQTNAKAAAVKRDAELLHNQDNQLAKKASEIRDALGQEELLRLNGAQQLVDRKRFSWTRLFSDLETALPQNVKVTRISVRDVATRGSRTSAQLEMTVIGKNPDDVTDMISEMDRGGVFRAEPLTQNLQKGRGETGTEWTLLVNYTPHSGVPASMETGDGPRAQLSSVNRVGEEQR